MIQNITPPINPKISNPIQWIEKELEKQKSRGIYNLFDRGAFRAIKKARVLESYLINLK